MRNFLVFIGLLFVSAVQAETIDFEGVGTIQGPPFDVDSMGYTVQYIVFGGSPEPGVRPGSLSPNGTDIYIMCGFCASTTGFNLYRNDSEPFRLYSIDLGGVDLDGAGSTTNDEFDFTLTGYLVGGGTVSAAATVAVSEGLITLIMDDSWRNLTSVKVIADNTGNVGFSGSAYDNIIVAKSVSIDVLPGNSANVIYPNRPGKLPVAVLSSASFDAAQVDPATLRFGFWEASPTEAATITNVDGEFGDDTRVRFKVPDAGIVCNDPDVSLSGETYAGEAITGFDLIDATDCEAGSCHVY